MTGFVGSPQLLFAQASKIQEQLIILKMKITALPKNKTHYVLLITGEIERTPS